MKRHYLDEPVTIPRWWKMKCSGLPGLLFGTTLLVALLGVAATSAMEGAKLRCCMAWGMCTTGTESCKALGGTEVKCPCPSPM